MQYFNLYANCKVVRGAARSTICDLQRQEVLFIPNEVADLLTLTQTKSVVEIKAHYEHAYDTIIDENFAWLEGKELGFFTQNPEWFAPIKDVWHEPYPLSNAIVDRDASSAYDLTEAVLAVGSMPCRHMQVRFFDEVAVSEITTLLYRLEKEASPLEGIEFVVPYHVYWQDAALQEALSSKPRFAGMHIYGAPENATISARRPNNTGHITFSTASIQGSEDCGCIVSGRFSSNMKMYTEAQSYNSCLNRKISIDSKGNIKNCPSMQRSYGNIADTSLRTALEHPDFKKLWGITKDQIHVCKDCEFRFICTDCRAYVEDPADIKSKPLKCGYNPYTAEWSDWKEDEGKRKIFAEYNTVHH
ncbi:MAG: grasp-with-spasm system SPASM domain peptide maturase [Bacteroidia bacterium]